DVRRLEGQRRRDRLGWTFEDWLHGPVFRKDSCAVWEQVIARTTERVEDRLRGLQEAEPVGPPVVIRATVGVLLGKVQSVRGIVRRPRAPLVLAVLCHEQPAPQRMVRGRESDAVRVAIAPGERLDRGLRVL